MKLRIQHADTGDVEILERVEYFEVRTSELYIERDGEGESFPDVVLGAGDTGGVL